MIFYGWFRRAILLARKLDWCEVKGDLASHVVARKVTIVHVYGIPVLPVWVSHVLFCEACGRETKLGWRQVRAALGSGELPLPPRPEFPAYARRVFEETGRTPRETDLDRLEINRNRGRWDTYLKVWLIVVPAAIVGLVILGSIR